MGCSPRDTQCGDDEKPPHPVTISKGFWLGQTLVTVAAWKRFRELTGAAALPISFEDRSDWNEANVNDSIPVVLETWDEAKSFCEWGGGRLPAEAEWEYAARAATTGPRYGDLDEIAWYSGNSASFVHPVGQKSANAWNLYDMLGNVWQWTNDRYSGKYYQAEGQVDPQGPSRGDAYVLGAGANSLFFRVLRGGSWNDFRQTVRVSNRGYNIIGIRFPNYGFRCVREMP
jgi:formylglycine-generating enzyme required for sulfatase activity